MARNTRNWIPLRHHGPVMVTLWVCVCSGMSVTKVANMELITTSTLNATHEAFDVKDMDDTAENLITNDPIASAGTTDPNIDSDPEQHDNQLSDGYINTTNSIDAVNPTDTFESYEYADSTKEDTAFAMNLALAGLIFGTWGVWCIITTSSQIRSWLGYAEGEDCWDPYKKSPTYEWEVEVVGDPPRSCSTRIWGHMWTATKKLIWALISPKTEGGRISITIISYKTAVLIVLIIIYSFAGVMVTHAITGTSIVSILQDLMIDSTTVGLRTARSAPVVNDTMTQEENLSGWSPPWCHNTWCRRGVGDPPQETSHEPETTSEPTNVTVGCAPRNIQGMVATIIVLILAILAALSITISMFSGTFSAYQQGRRDEDYDTHPDSLNQPRREQNSFGWIPCTQVREMTEEGRSNCYRFFHYLTNLGSPQPTVERTETFEMVDFTVDQATSTVVNATIETTTPTISSTATVACAIMGTSTATVTSTSTDKQTNPASTSTFYVELDYDSDLAPNETYDDPNYDTIYLGADPDPAEGIAFTAVGQPDIF